MLNGYIPIFIFLLVAIGFALFTLMMSQLVQSKKYNKVKLEPYECGIEPTTDARDRSPAGAVSVPAQRLNCPRTFAITRCRTEK